MHQLGHFGSERLLGNVGPWVGLRGEEKRERKNKARVVSEGGRKHSQGLQSFELTACWARTSSMRSRESRVKSLRYLPTSASVVR